MDKKLTDNEIIKALECCSVALMYDEEQSLYRLALDLINRQKAEIEYYSHNTKTMANDIRDLQKALERAKAEIGRLRAERDKEHDWCNHCAIMCAKIKAEAIKEFADRFKKRIAWRYTTALWKPLCEMVDNLVKEMVGDVDGKVDS